MFTLSVLRCLYTAVAVFFVTGLFCSSPSAARAATATFADFEQGNTCFIAISYPAHVEAGNLVLNADTPLSGRLSLRLTAKKGGGYTLGSTLLHVTPQKEYSVSFSFRNAAPCRLRAEVVGKGQGGLGALKTVAKKFSPGKHVVRLPFIKPAMKVRGNAFLSTAVWVRVNVESAGAVDFDDFSLSGPTLPPPPRRLELAVDAPMGVYRVGESAYMSLYAPPAASGKIVWEMYDFMGSAVKQGVLRVDSMNPVDPPKLLLPTQKRGYYTMHATFMADGGGHGEVTQKSYVVLTPSCAGADNLPRFGVTFEEYASKSQTLAGVSREELYDIYRDMGVGAMRFFSPASPKVVAPDDTGFDFTGLDYALGLAKSRGIQCFIPLGSSFPDGLPAWMRTDSSKGNIDLLSMLKTRKLQERAAQRGGGKFLSMAAYSVYLDKVMTHLRGKGVDYEIWNEPGHKFSPEDVAKLVAATREARDRNDPQARILGFSSSKGPGAGKGRNPDVIPAFYDNMLGLAGKDIDIVSYHSGHAFRFLGKRHDLRNQETGYPDRLRWGLARHRLSEKPIWDTERAAPWQSNAALDLPGNDDQAGQGDIALDIHVAMTGIELARQLPMIYAAGFHAGVERIFWFNGEIAKSFLNFSPTRFLLWDIMLDPSPMLAAYDAMTDMLRNTSRVSELHESGNGNRAYWFDAGKGGVLLCSNWKGRKGVVTLTGVNGRVSVYDLMGNKRSEMVADGTVSIDINQWPQYLELTCKPDSVVLH